MSIQEIEARANIVHARRRRVIAYWHLSKSAIYSTRCDRIIERLYEEYADLESMYRVERKRAHDLKMADRFLNELAEIGIVIE